jgi:hypothetical protein
MAHPADASRRGGAADPTDRDEARGAAVATDDGDGARRVRPAEVADDGRGDGLLRVDLCCTVALTVASIAAAAVPDVFVFVSVPVALVLFLGGCAAFAWAYAVGVGRSRFEAVTLAGLFWPGVGVAPARPRRRLRLLLAVQVVVSVAAALARPFTPLAFGVLAPTVGLGLMALWSARHGRFGPKPGAARGERRAADPPGAAQ